MAARICVVGSSNIDLTFRTPRLPQAGETLLAPEFHLGYGGKGANQAVMAARLGAEVRMVTRIGHGVFADGIRSNFAREGIGLEFVLSTNAYPTGVAAIMVDDAARNCILIHPGANQALTKADVTAAAAAFAGVDFVLAQLETPQEATLEAFRLARTAGVRTLLNPAPAASNVSEILALTDVCVPNEHELAVLVDDPSANLEASAHALRRLGPPTVIVTLGERGALLATAAGTSVVPAPRVDAIDSSGAGDAFIGALAVFLTEGKSLTNAVAWANQVAALSVTRSGTQSSFPRRAEITGLE